jgi:hypothetical protein
MEKASKRPFFAKEEGPRPPGVRETFGDFRKIRRINGRE